MEIKWKILCRSVAVGFAVGLGIWIISGSDAAFGFGIVVSWLEYLRKQ